MSNSGRDIKLHVPVDDQSASQAEPKARVCPECGSARLMHDSEAAEIVCMDCGVVVQQKLTDRGPEWRAFDDEQRSKRTRVGAPLTYTIHDKGLSTTIDWHDRDIYGKSLSPGQKRRFIVCVNGSAVSASPTQPNATSRLRCQKLQRFPIT